MEQATGVRWSQRSRDLQPHLSSVSCYVGPRWNPPWTCLGLLRPGKSEPERVHGASPSRGLWGCHPPLLPATVEPHSHIISENPSALAICHLGPSTRHNHLQGQPGSHFISVNRNQQVYTVIYFNVFLRTEWKSFKKKIFRPSIQGVFYFGGGSGVDFLG